MSTIDRLQQMLVELRTSASAVATRAGSGPATARASVAPVPQQVQSLQEQVSGRLRRLDPTARDFARRSRMAFLESVLTREFGDGIAMDPEFNVLVEKVSDLISQDEEASAQLDRLLMQAATSTGTGSA